MKGEGKGLGHRALGFPAIGGGSNHTWAMGKSHQGWGPLGQVCRPNDWFCNGDSNLLPSALATLENRAVALAEGRTTWNQRPPTSSPQGGRGGDSKGSGMKYGYLWRETPSEGLQPNDLPSRPLSILNFKFIIRKNTLAVGRGREAD